MNPSIVSAGRTKPGTIARPDALGAISVSPRLLMRFVQLASAASVALFLAACGNNPPNQASSSSSAAANDTPLPNTTQVAGPANDDALKPLYGTWALDPANCGDQVLKISKTRFDGPGSGCEITNFTDNGDGTYTAAMTCTANGQSAAEKVQMTPIFAPTGEGIALVYLDRKNLTSEVFRCRATDGATK